MLVIRSRPRATSRRPLTIEIGLRYFAILARNFWLLPTEAAIKRNGTASPSEKIASKNAPSRTVAELAVRRRTEAKIGPTQGVQPKAKAEPKRKELIGVPSFFLAILICLSRDKAGRSKAPSIKRPKTITKRPPIRASQSRNGTRAAPKKPASEPKTMKMREKPKT